MKKVFLLVLMAISLPVFSSVSYGFLNQDVDYNSCFIGIDGDSFEFTGVVSNRFLSYEQREEMNFCQSEKGKGYNAVIEVTTTPDTQVGPTGLTTHFPKFDVKCVYLKDSTYRGFIQFWRTAVKGSNFRRCF